MYSIQPFIKAHRTPPKIDRLKAQLQASTDAIKMNSEDFFDMYYNMYDNDKFKGNIVKIMIKKKKHTAFITENYPELVIKFI